MKRRAFRQEHFKLIKRWRQQHRAYNESGRARTHDHLMMPNQQKLKGRHWKSWTPSAVLRAAFAAQRQSLSAVASQIDGASASHCRVAAYHNSLPHNFKIVNLMWDETSLDLGTKHGVKDFSCLASHAEVSWGQANGSFQDEPVIRRPRLLQRTTASCMYAALHEGVGGLGSQTAQGSQTASGAQTATLLTSDAAASNILVAKVFESRCSDDHPILHCLCLQHRTGNVVERLTRHLGNLAGSYCVAKSIHKAGSATAMEKEMHNMFNDKLVFRRANRLDLERDPQRQDEKNRSRAFLDLCLLEDPDSEHLRTQHIEKFLDFFGSARGDLLQSVCNERAIISHKCINFHI